MAIPTADDVVEVFRDITEKSALVLDAIEERRIIPYFQPILDVATKKIVAYEVLSRIEVGGEIMRAEEFVEIAEKMGVIHRLDALVIERALGQLKELGHDGYVFINLSPRALVLNEFARNVRQIVSDSGIPRERIVFEITERDTVKNLPLLGTLPLRNSSSKASKLAIDDFGSGFSSFHYLRRFPIDFLKIRRRFHRQHADQPEGPGGRHQHQVAGAGNGHHHRRRVRRVAGSARRAARHGRASRAGYYVGGNRHVTSSTSTGPARS